MLQYLFCSACQISHQVVIHELLVEMFQQLTHFRRKAFFKTRLGFAFKTTFFLTHNLLSKTALLPHQQEFLQSLQSMWHKIDPGLIPIHLLRVPMPMLLLLSKIKEKKLYGSFLWISVNCFQAAGSLQKGILLLTTKFYGVPGNHLIDLRRMKH